MNDFYLLLDDITAAQMFDLIGNDFENAPDWYITNHNAMHFSFVNGGYHFQGFGWASEHSSNEWDCFNYIQARTAIDVAIRMSK